MSNDYKSSSFSKEEKERIAYHREKLESYFASHVFTGVGDGDNFKISILAKPSEIIRIHFAEIHLTGIIQDSVYSITSFNGESASSTSGTPPQVDINEITEQPSNRALINPSESGSYNVPFTQSTLTALQVTQGASTFISFNINDRSTRNLVDTPIILNNVSGNDRYIILEGQVVDLLIPASSNSFNVTVGVFYSIENRQI